MKSQIESFIKSFIWRIVGVLVLGSVTFYYTRHWVSTSWITFLHHFVFLFVFWIHERFWFHVDYENKILRSVLKCITYETILGTFILGIITLAITGNIQQMSQITITYIGIKHVLYVINEFIWPKLTEELWGKY